MPFDLAKLIQPDYADYKYVLNITDLEFLENMADTEHFIKMFKFKIWADYMVNKGEFGNLSDVLKAEVKVFEDHGFPKKTDFHVKENCKCG